MAIRDNIQRFIFDQLPIRGGLIHLETCFDTILQQHAYPPAIHQLLGEALCIAALLCGSIKFQGRLTLQFRGEQELKLLLVQSDHEFNLRGVARWEGEISEENLIKALESGVLSVRLASENNRAINYQGVVAWQNHSFIHSIEGYFQQSEQLTTKFWITVQESRASALFLQMMPVTQAQTAEIESEIAQLEWARIVHRCSCLSSDLLLSADNEAILSTCYPNESIRLYPQKTVQFRCNCSHERSVQAILTIGRVEAEAELSNRSSIIVTCDFCNKEYTFNRDEVEAIFQKSQASSSS